jgi:hypothetical protein
VIDPSAPLHHETLRPPRPIDAAWDHVQASPNSPTKKSSPSPSRCAATGQRERCYMMIRSRCLSFVMDFSKKNFWMSLVMLIGVPVVINSVACFPSSKSGSAPLYTSFSAWVHRSQRSSCRRREQAVKHGPVEQTTGY